MHVDSAQLAVISEFSDTSRRHPVSKPPEGHHEKNSVTTRHFIPRIPALHPFGAVLLTFKSAVLRICLRLSGK
jgi:hypothetical protein